MPRMNDSSAPSMAFMFASEIMPASATTVTSGSWWAAMNSSMTDSIVLVSARLSVMLDRQRPGQRAGMDPGPEPGVDPSHLLGGQRRIQRHGHRGGRGEPAA